MSSITTINGTDVISTSRTTINTNFSNLNTDKIETSYLDTDTTLAANSDAKIASQKATKAYVDANLAQNASTTAKGIAEEATQAEVTAGTATGGTGARLFVNPSTAVASTTDRGMVEEATQAEVDAGTAVGGSGARLFINPSTQRTPFFHQMIPIDGTTDSAAWNGSASNPDGSVLVIIANVTNEMFRYARDSATGMYFLTHNVSITPGGTSFASVTILGNYVYFFWDNNTVIGCYRYDLATLANETLMTVPAIDTAGTNYVVGSWTDGTYIYVVNSKGTETAYKMSVSGTTFSAVSNVTTSGLANYNSNMYDGTSVYYALSFGTNTDCNIYKLTNVNGSSYSTTTKKLTIFSDNANGSVLINIDNNRMYVGRIEKIYDEAAGVKGVMNLYPITKP